MSFWAKALGIAGPVTPNDNGPADVNPGEDGAIEFTGEELEQRSLPVAIPSAWDGVPTGWNMSWDQIGSRVNQLADIAWQCLDLNSNIVSAMPVYRTQNGSIVDPTEWMENPDPSIYSCWQEFMKQFFWDYQMGEVFVIPMFTSASTGKPTHFRVIPPFLVTVEMMGSRRDYRIGAENVTDRILHIRYSGNTISPRGVGPLEVAGAKLTQIALLQRYVTSLAETGGVPLYWIGVERKLSKGEGQDLLTNWMDARTKNVGKPAVLGSGATLNQARTMDAKEMGLLEISQFSESRIAGLLGVPPFLVGLAGASGSLTYSNIADLYDFHDRSSLRPKIRMLMKSLSSWSLPPNEEAELNRDDYTRLSLDKRVAIYKELIAMKVINSDDVKVMERFIGAPASQALTGGNS